MHHTKLRVPSHFNGTLSCNLSSHLSHHINVVFSLLPFALIAMDGLLKPFLKLISIFLCFLQPKHDSFYIILEN